MRKKIDTFCLKHPDFGIPNLIRYITIANAVMWLLNMVNPRILPYMMFNPYYILHGQVWRLISFMFIPPSTGVLALIAFYFYYFIGTTLERQWGTARFNIYFFSGIILTVIYGFLVYFIAHMAVSLTAEYIYLSMFFSFAALFPDMQVLLFFIIPIKMKWLALVDAAFFLVNVFSLPFPANLLPVVAILNFILFCGEDCSVCSGCIKRVLLQSTSSVRQRKSVMNRRQTFTGINAQSAAARIRIILILNSVTAPNALAIIASVRITSTATFISQNEKGNNHEICQHSCQRRLPPRCG